MILKIKNLTDLNKPQQEFLEAIKKLDKGQKPILVQRGRSKKLILPDNLIELHQMFLRYCQGDDIRTEINESLEDRMSNEGNEELPNTSSKGMLERSKKK
jgi:hypothetical protein